MRKTRQKIKPSRAYLLWAILLIVGYFFYKNIDASVFLHNNDKINIVFYGKKTRFYSIDRRGLDYFITFPSDARVLVPGGYGYYRTGAINKLATLEKKPDLIRKTFSWATSSMVDLYFYPTTTSIFYKEDSEPGISPTLYEIMLNPGNANLVDRFFILGSLLGKTKNSYKAIELDNNFSHENFISDNMGVFYKKSYRDSHDNVQIKYPKSYKTALLISNILDGEGIRVVDLAEDEKGSHRSQCEIVTTADKKDSPVVKGLKRFFDCRLTIGETAVSDIILKLGSLERDWEVE